jgi:hypothetical protein
MYSIKLPSTLVNESYDELIKGSSHKKKVSIVVRMTFFLALMVSLILLKQYITSGVLLVIMVAALIVKLKEDKISLNYFSRIDFYSGEISVELSNEGILYKYNNKSFSFSWNIVDRILETSNGYVVHLELRLFIVLPKAELRPEDAELIKAKKSSMANFASNGTRVP